MENNQQLHMIQGSRSFYSRVQLQVLATLTSSVWQEVPYESVYLGSQIDKGLLTYACYLTNTEDPTATKVSLAVLLQYTFFDVYFVKETQLLLCSQEGKGKENTGLTDNIIVTIIV